MSDNLPVIVLGAGGHSKVLIETLLLHSIKIIGISVPLNEANIKSIYGIEIMGDDTKVLNYLPSEVRLVNGIGSIESTENRKRLFDWFKNRGFSFANVIHPSAIISTDAQLSEGVQIMAGSVIQAGSKICQNSIINTRTSIDHDCYIGSHVHIAPGTTISGSVSVDNETHIGTGTTIIQGIYIGKRSLVGAGSVVINDIQEGKTVMGVPAKEVNHGR